ncbi:MAG: hypothetical protein V7767_08440 [Leeuwenhoekiella sp.]
MKTKSILCLLLFFATTLINAQTKGEAEKTVVEFFDAFHKQDTTRLRSLCYEKITMQSISEKSGETVLKSEDFGDFLKSIASKSKQRHLKNVCWVMK